MKATLLDDRLTPLTAPEVIRATRDALRDVTGSEPTDAAVALFVAHSALETGRWKSIHWFNATNIKASETYEGFYTLYRCNEVIDGVVKWFDPPHPQCRFRAYPDATAGIRDSLRLLSTRARFFPAWTAGLAGDAERFVDALKQGAFFTAGAGPYKRAVVSLQREYLKLLGEMGPATMRPAADVHEAEHSAMSDEDMGRLLPLVWEEAEWRAARDAAIRETT